MLFVRLVLDAVSEGLPCMCWVLKPRLAFDGSRELHSDAEATYSQPGNLTYHIGKTVGVWGTQPGESTTIVALIPGAVHINDLESGRAAKAVLKSRMRHQDRG